MFKTGYKIVYKELPTSVEKDLLSVEIYGMYIYPCMPDFT